METTDNRIVFIADADIDCDGSGGNPDHDPYYQSETTLKFRGRSLNAYKERFVVVPPVVAKHTVGIVLGSHAFVTNLKTNKMTTAVVGDIGPMTKIGELSVACAIAIGLDGNPNHGGTDEQMIGYEVLPGVAAFVDGVVYDLQPYGSFQL